MSEVVISAEVLWKAFENYQDCKGRDKLLTNYLTFKKLIEFDKYFIRTEEGEGAYSSEAKHYTFTEEGARNIQLIASPHAHAMIRLMMINQIPDTETEDNRLIARIEDSL